MPATATTPKIVQVFYTGTQDTACCLQAWAVAAHCICTELKLRHSHRHRSPNVIFIFFSFKDFIDFWGQWCGLAAKALHFYAPGSHMGTGSSPGTSTSHPAPCLCPGESSGGWAKTLGPCTHVGELEEAPGSWLWTSSVLAVAAT